jgi:hypothetical protein
VGRLLSDSTDLSLRVNLHVLALLSALRLYVDHTSFRLKRSYGSDSPEATKFQQLLQQAYDGHFSYRFLYKLRNFSQHCGMPVGHVALNSRAVNPPDPTAEHTLRVTFRTAELLAEDRSVWGGLATELQQLPDEPEVTPLLREVTPMMLEINQQIAAAERPHLERHASKIHEIVAEAFVDSGGPVVGEIQDAEHGARFRAMPPPISMMNELGYHQYKRVP